MVPRKIVEKIVENSWLDPMKFIKLRVVTFKCSNWDPGKPFYGLRSEELMIKSDGWQCHGLSSKLFKVRLVNYQQNSGNSNLHR